MSDAAVASTKTAPPDEGGGAKLPCVSKCCASVAGVVPDPIIRLCFSPGKGPFYAFAVFILSLTAYFSSLDDEQLETMNKVSLVFTVLSLVAALFLYFLGAFEFASLVQTVNGNTDTLNDLRNYMFGDDEEKDRLRKEHIERKNKAAAVAVALFLRQQEAAAVAAALFLDNKKQRKRQKQRVMVK
jgi:biotin transporter BioY